MSQTEYADLVARDRLQLHPVYHPKQHQNPLVVERGEGVWLTTGSGSAGRRR